MGFYLGLMSGTSLLDALAKRVAPSRVDTTAGARILGGVYR
jgi:hypothetical protein